jgi:PadR family transcriptional regulator PadR
MSRNHRDQLQGALDLLILRSLVGGALHGYGIVSRIRDVSEELKVEEGSLYPALHRMEQTGWIEAQWGISETNRRARFYHLTPAGRKHLAEEQEHWTKVTAAVSRFLRYA